MYSCQQEDNLHFTLRTMKYISTIFVYNMPTLTTSNVNRSNKKWFMLKMTRCRRYPADTIVDTDYAGDLAVLVNTLDQAESMPHSEPNRVHVS